MCHNSIQDKRRKNRGAGGLNQENKRTGGKTMKKTILAALMVAFLSGCSKEDNTVTITNLSGKSWYETQVWFRQTEDGELSGYTDVGTVDVGSSCVVETDDPIFYIYAKDNRGKMIMSKNIHINGSKATVKESDLY